LQTYAQLPLNTPSAFDQVRPNKALLQAPQTR
jgi:hypothetical protein